MGVVQIAGLMEDRRVRGEEMAALMARDSKKIQVGPNTRTCRELTATQNLTDRLQTVQVGWLSM